MTTSLDTRVPGRSHASEASPTAPKETKLSFAWLGDATTLNHKRKEKRS